MVGGHKLDENLPALRWLPAPSHDGEPLAATGS
jgi:hypothetical protein